MRQTCLLRISSEKKDNEYYSNLKGKLISKAMNMNPSKLPCEEALES
jgi:hypothetical protein